MGLSCLIGPAQTFDAVAYARAMVEDDAATLSIPDTRVALYLDSVAKDFSRFVPLDQVVGDPNAGTSPLNTVSGQQRYVCNPANGFSARPTSILTVQTSTTGLNAANDTAYFFLNPYATAQGFLGPAAIDNPSRRIIRDEYLGELDAYGKAWYDVVRDPGTGLPALDLYPIPQSVNPVYVRYQGAHAAAWVSANPTYPTIPEELTRCFADLLYAQVLLEQANRMALRGRSKAGMIEREGNADSLRMLALDVRERVYQELGAGPVAVVG